MIRPRTAFPAVCSSLFLLACASGIAQDRSGGRADRMAPPSAVTCDRNQLTSYTGEVTRYESEGEQTRLEIRTDWDTVEQVVIEHPGEVEVSAYFLIWAKPFTSDQWVEIRQENGQLQPGMRATAWVCSDGVTPPLIDWQPSPQD